MTADNANDFAYEPVDGHLSSAVKRAYWDAAMGLQAVDGLRPSSYLRQLADDNVNDVRSLDETRALLRVYYQERGVLRGGSCASASLDEAPSGAEHAAAGEVEADFVSQRIVELLAGQAFSLIPDMLTKIHEHLFSDLDAALYRPGQYKDVALQKAELVLNGDSVVYADPTLIGSSLKFAFDEERDYCYGPDFDSAQLDHFTRFIARIWQVHPFFEGNTRTVAVFTILYLRDLGFDVDNGPFALHAAYFRDALVRANYRNAAARVMPDRSFLSRFFDNALNGASHELRSRDLMAGALFENPDLLRNVNPSRALIRP